MADIIREIDRIIMMKAGRVHADGPKCALLTAPILSEHFHAEVQVSIEGDGTRAPFYTPGNGGLTPGGRQFVLCWASLWCSLWSRLRLLSTNGRSREAVYASRSDLHAF